MGKHDKAEALLYELLRNTNKSDNVEEENNNDVIIESGVAAKTKFQVDDDSSDTDDESDLVPIFQKRASTSNLKNDEAYNDTVDLSETTTLSKPTI
eukprot:CAMPEP_0202457086 /NCGR_PEP_ID=MMETSP1360-20130828/14189_1 /ASSEMBLY_ACC=CAM_ASM_000848 /TAXON_ID=515479 /ORGANISM="Licmophora paradoxa, Strain CCMP2313" /LENGTH=95 /DNA_ID=CAMNT_0049077075 /DNA_START=3 /DNA_END=287 /DNA_ORIENTATION=-